MLSFKPWRAEAVILFIAAQAFCFFFGGTVIALLHKEGLAGFKSVDDFGSVLVGTLSLQGVTWILMWLFLRYHRLDWRDALGFRKPRWFLALLLAFFVVVLVLPPALWLQSLSITLMEKIGWEPEAETAVSLLANAESLKTQIYLAAFAVVLAPVAEEFIFRGVLFPFLKQLGFPKTAWIGVSLFFALFHFNAAAFLPLFVLALAFTWLYQVTDCLLAPIFAHALFNAANLVLLKYLPQ